MLFICGQSFVSGGEQVLKSLIQNLRIAGPKYLICKDDPKIIEFFSISNVEVIPFKFFIPLSDLKSKFGFGAYPIKAICNLFFAIFFLKIILKYRPQIIVSNNFSEIPFSLVAFFFKIPFVQYVHEIVDDAGKIARVVRFFQNFINVFICVSKSAQFSMKKVLKVDKTKLLYNGTDIFLDAHAKKFKSDPLELVFIGMLNENKDPIRFLKWLKILHQSYKVSGKVLYHIFEPDLLVQAKSFCEANGLQVTWVQGAEGKEIKAAIVSATFVCITSKKEALSLIALQSLALGTPVITSENGGVQELVLNEVNGFVIRDDDDILRKLPMFLNEGNYRLLSEECLKDAKKYTHEIQAEEFVKIIKNI